MLRENDTFEVVFYPGTDKVEKQCLGPVPAFAWDTGWRESSTAQPLKNRIAERIYFIGAVRGRQFCGGLLVVPFGKGGRRRDAGLRCGDHAMKRWKVLD